MLKGSPRISSARMPPVAAKGTFTSAAGTTALNLRYNRMKIVMSANGTATSKRWLALSSCSNCPPHSTEYPSGKSTSLSTSLRASATKPQGRCRGRLIRRSRAANHFHIKPLTLAASTQLNADGSGFSLFSLGCGIDRVAPDRYDILGAAVCLVGVAIIMYTPR